jgi:hypothetical protein
VDAEPNATVKSIVETLLESANLPSPETVRQINEETTTALTTDHNLGYQSILGPLKAKLEDETKRADETFAKYSNESREHVETKLALAAMTTYRDQIAKERDDIVRARSSPIYISVYVASLAVEPRTISRGKTLKIRYMVESSQAVNDDIWLGAAFPDKNNKYFYNTAQDKPIRLLEGLHEYDRELTIPSDTPPGNYMLGASVWHGVLSDSTKATRLA